MKRLSSSNRLALLVVKGTKLWWTPVPRVPSFKPQKGSLPWTVLRMEETVLWLPTKVGFGNALYIVPEVVYFYEVHSLYYTWTIISSLNHATNFVSLQKGGRREWRWGHVVWATQRKMINPLCGIKRVCHPRVGTTGKDWKISYN